MGLNTDQVVHYEVNTPESEKSFSYMGKPAWSYKEPDKVYFMAGDTVGVDYASIFTVNVNQSSLFARDLDASTFVFRNSLKEDITKATDLVGR